MEENDNNKIVLIVDDEENIRNLLKEILEEENYKVILAKNGKEAVEKTAEKYPDCILMDVKMPVMDGMAAFLRIKEQSKEIPVIFLTAHGSADLTISAMKSGAYDYLTKPFDIEEVKIKVKKALELKALFNFKVSKKSSEFINGDEMIGNSPLMQEIYKSIGRVAPLDTTVLILGESGTGKEMVAKAIYKNSFRKDKPFVIINCAAIPENLLESELFGHEKGAFTDAYQTHQGKFELAKDGTIFLDEIGDMTLNLQAKLLRVLQDGAFERIGGKEKIYSNARVIAATNKDLEAIVKEKAFREDLFYRLNVISIKIPPLRERKEDIPILTDYFIKKYSHKYNKKVLGAEPETIEILIKYDWPGNVRELENTLARGVILTNTQLILKEHIGNLSLKIEESGEKSFAQKKESPISVDLENLPLNEAISKIEYFLILKALKEAKGNKTKAAQILKISRKSLFNKLREYNIGEYLEQE